MKYYVCIKKFETINNCFETKFFVSYFKRPYCVLEIFRENIKDQNMCAAVMLYSLNIEDIIDFLEEKNYITASSYISRNKYKYIVISTLPYINIDNGTIVIDNNLFIFNIRYKIDNKEKVFVFSIKIYTGMYRYNKEKLNLMRFSLSKFLKCISDYDVVINFDEFKEIDSFKELILYIIDNISNNDYEISYECKIKIEYVNYLFRYLKEQAENVLL